MTIVIAATASLVVGATGGLLIGRSINAEWFEAVGTWVGALASGVAVALAYGIFRSEDRMRRQEAIDERERARDQRLIAEAEGQQKEADQVVFDKINMGGNNLGSGRLKVTAYSLRVGNHSRYAIADVDLRADGMPGWIKIWNTLSPGQVEVCEVRSIPETDRFETTDSRTEQLRLARVRFTMDGVRWEVHGGSVGATQVKS